MSDKQFITNIRQKIADDHIKEAVDQLKRLLENSPQLNQILLQSARFNGIMRQIRQGTVSFEDADITQNKIRIALLDLVSEIETQETKPEIQKELADAISVINSKNVIIGSKISAGGNVHIGDQTIQTESESSKKLRLFLFIFVPALAIGGAFFWNQYEEMKRPLSLKVLIENTTSNSFLSEPEGKLVLTYGGNPVEKENIRTEALFESIPANYKGDLLRLQYSATGFEPVDTAFKYQKSILLKVRRNQNLAILKGIIFEEIQGQNIPIEDVKVTLDCCEAMTDASGSFTIQIPFSQQQPKQRITLYKEGYQRVDTQTPVIKGEIFREFLVKN